MYDTDAAGILYFGSQFRFAHDAFETVMAKEGLTFHRFFESEPFLFVIVHAESDYFSSLHVGDDITVQLVVDHIGTTSFRISYTIAKSAMVVGKVQTTHVCVNKVTRKKQPLPVEPLIFSAPKDPLPIPKIINAIRKCFITYSWSQWLPLGSLFPL
ncbi:acyl-CoA thioesterase [bacterium]|nr:acyl-CoA thioesterase [bacterium]